MLPLLPLIVMATGCGVLGLEDPGGEPCLDQFSECAVEASLLSGVVAVEVDAGSSCGLRSVRIDYQGARWLFDLADDQEDQPGWARDGVVVRVGSFDSEVWAIDPDGSRWSLIRLEEASLLLCLY